MACKIPARFVYCSGSKKKLGSQHSDVLTNVKNISAEVKSLHMLSVILQLGLLWSIAWPRFFLLTLFINLRLALQGNLGMTSPNLLSASKSLKKLLT